MLLLLAGCTDAHLYGRGLDDTQPNRLAMTGVVCTEDARQAGFEVKVLFLVDTASGPLFSDFDPELARLRALSETVNRYSGGAGFSFSVASFGPYARLLASTTTGGYTTNPGELDSAIATLGLPQGCLGGSCRSYDDGLELAESIIEGDLADLNAGQRVRTQYVVVMMAAGLPDPLPGTWDETVEQMVADVSGLRERVEDAGALSFSLHALQLAAVDPSNPDLQALADTEDLLQQIALVGAGRFERFDSPDEATLDRVGLLQLSALLEAKSLVVTNLSVLPHLSGPLVDSDLDGLSDDAEALMGTFADARDSDGDGLGDLVETFVSLDPLVIDDPPSPCTPLGPPPWLDDDTDHMNDCEEILLGTDPSLPDSDGDALPDWLEVLNRTDYLSADLLDDVDWDGAPNGQEVLAHTDPGTSDATSHLSDAYRYEVTDLGFSTEPTVLQPRLVAGVRVRLAGPDNAGGLGTLRYEPGTPATLSWRSPRDDTPGPAVSVPQPGNYRLDSATPNRWLDVAVTPGQFPPDVTEELLLVELAERDCVEWTVRNVRLVETADGVNDVFVYFAEAPLGQFTRPGLFRLAHVPVFYDPETGRVPSEPLVPVGDEEFVSIGD